MRTWARGRETPRTGTHTHACVQTSTRKCKQERARTQTSFHTHTQTQTHTNTHTHTYFFVVNLEILNANEKSGVALRLGDAAEDMGEGVGDDPSQFGNRANALHGEGLA